MEAFSYSQHFSGFYIVSLINDKRSTSPDSSDEEGLSMQNNTLSVAEIETHTNRDLVKPIAPHIEISKLGLKWTPLANLWLLVGRSKKRNIETFGLLHQEWCSPDDLKFYQRYCRCWLQSFNIASDALWMKYSPNRYPAQPCMANTQKM